MECGDDMVADDEMRASHGGRRNQGLLWFFGASATLGVAAVTAITCAVIRYGWNDGEFWKLVVPAAVALVAAIVWAALGFMRRAGRTPDVPADANDSSPAESRFDSAAAQILAIVAINVWGVMFIVFDTFQIDPWRYVTWVVPVMFLLYLAVLGIGRACFRKRQKDIRFPEEPSMTSSRPSYLA